MTIQDKKDISAQASFHQRLSSISNLSNSPLDQEDNDSSSPVSWHTNWNTRSTTSRTSEWVSSQLHVTEV